MHPPVVYCEHSALCQLGLSNHQVVLLFLKVDELLLTLTPLFDLLAKQAIFFLDVKTALF